MQLTVQLDGKPVYLYEIIVGRYEDSAHYFCAHTELLTCAEIIRRIHAVSDELPKEIEYDYMFEPREPDLFERALTLAGFVELNGVVPIGLILRSLGRPCTKRTHLKQALATALLAAR